MKKSDESWKDSFNSVTAKIPPKPPKILEIIGNIKWLREKTPKQRIIAIILIVTLLIAGSVAGYFAKKFLWPSTPQLSSKHIIQDEITQRIGKFYQDFNTAICKDIDDNEKIARIYNDFFYKAEECDGYAYKDISNFINALFKRKIEFSYEYANQDVPKQKEGLLFYEVKGLYVIPEELNEPITKSFRQTFVTNDGENWKMCGWIEYLD